MSRSIGTVAFAFGLVSSVMADEFLGDAHQLTFPNQFAKAGEAYFSPHGEKVVFQAVERVGDEEQEDPFYAMFVADLAEVDGVPKLENIKRVSPEGSANTCGWFDPVDPDVLWFASTVVPPTASEAPGYQRASGRYKWMFPPQMRIVRTRLSSADGTPASLEVVEGDGSAYVAEGSLSPDGRHLVFCSLASGQGDLFITDLKTGETVPVVTKPGYDGGPFFSPDGNRICYRSDRHNNNHLQLFVAELSRDETGAINGITREHQLTDNTHVNWCPFWHPAGAHLVYATSELGHANYEVFIIDAWQDDHEDPTDMRYGTAQRRVTRGERADVLPAFNLDGSWMMWTSQRGVGGTSQLWIAPFELADQPSTSVGGTR